MVAYRWGKVNTHFFILSEQLPLFFHYYKRTLPGALATAKIAHTKSCVMSTGVVMLDIDTKLLLPCGLVGYKCAKSGQKVPFSCCLCLAKYYVWHTICSINNENKPQYIVFEMAFSRWQTHMLCCRIVTVPTCWGKVLSFTSTANLLF